MASISHDAMSTGAIGKRRLEWQGTVCTLLLLGVAFLVVYPLVVLVISSFQLTAPGEPPVYGFQAWQAALSQPSILRALFNTFTIATTQVSISTAIAVIIAWVLARTNIMGRGWLELGFWISYFIPTLPVVLGWILILDPHFGLANQLVDSIVGQRVGLFNIYSWWGIIWAHLITHAVSIKVLLLVSAFRNMDSALEEASLTTGANDIRTALRITLPVMLPAIAAVTLLSLIHSFEAFEIELILGVPQNISVYSTMIYRLVRGDPPAVSPAAAMGLMLMFVMVPLVLFQYFWVSRRNYATVSSRIQVRQIELGRWCWPLFAMTSSFVILLTIIPLIFLVMGTFMKMFGVFSIANPWTTKQWAGALADSSFTGAVFNTFNMAIGTAVFLTALASLISYVIVRTRYRGRALLGFLTWVPAMVPSVLMSLAVLTMFLSLAVFRVFYGTIFILIFAFTLSGMALAVQIFRAAFQQLGNDLEEASWLAGGSWWPTYRRIILPILAPTMISVTIIIFVQTTRNIGTVALLATSDTTPLSLLQLQYMADGLYERSGVVGVIIVVLTLSVTLLARRFGLSLGVGGGRQ